MNVRRLFFILEITTISMWLMGCEGKPPVSPKAIGYGVELEECNRTAKTCEESIACENKVRARYGRPARTGGCE